MPRPSTTSSPSSASAPALGIFGQVEPRIWTPPLRPLTPDTSYGFDEIRFAREVVGIELDPWEQWLSIHAGELLPDGRPRFRTVLALVARQNGKSTWARVKILYWMFVDLPAVPSAESPFIIATSTDRSYAKKFWTKTGDLIRRNKRLAADLAEIRLTVSEECITTTDGVEYGFAANNASAGRSRTVRRALIDEVREHKNLDAWGAITGAMNAVPDGQVVCISNQGDDTAALLDALHTPALTFIRTGEGDPRLGLFEWSSPDGADPTDLEALAQANPNLGHRVDVDALLGAAQRAKAAGGLELNTFRTEAMCQRVTLLDPNRAVNPAAWSRCHDPGSLDEYRRDVVCFLDVAPDQLHATLYAAALMPDGRVRLDFVREWHGVDCADQAGRDLPDLMTRIRPRVLGWLPGGPAASMAADMRARRRTRAAAIDLPAVQKWPPRGVKLMEIKTDVPAVCMGFAKQVAASRVAHSDDPLLNSQIDAAQPLHRGDVWVFSRRGDGHVDAVYAAAGADYLARTLPPRPRAVVLVPNV